MIFSIKSAGFPKTGRRKVTMELPAALKQEIEQRCAAHSPQTLSAAARALSERYRKESGQGKRLLTADIEALAYAVVRMSATYGAVYTALGHALASFSGEIRSVLDVGAGTGAACWAARELLPEAAEFTCLEREGAMLRLGSGLMQADDHLAQARWLQQDVTKEPIRHRADLVIASYAMNEMTREGRESLLQALWAQTDQLLLILEPGTPVGSGQLRRAKEILTALGGQVVAPCPGNAPCPLAGDDWCHFTCRISRSRLHKQLKEGDVPYEDEKFSYLAVAKTPGSPVAGRILRHPMKNPGHIALRLCTPEGIRDLSVTKKQGELFKKARKSAAGDPFP